MGRRFGVRTRVLGVSGVVFGAVVGTIAFLLWNALAMAITDSAEDVSRSTVARMAIQLPSNSPLTVAPEVPPVADRVQQIWSPEGLVLATSNRKYPNRVGLAVGQHPPLGETVVVRGALGDGDQQGPAVAAIRRVMTDSGAVLTVVAVESAHIQATAQKRLFLLSSTLVVAAFIVLLRLLSYALQVALDPVELMRLELERITSSKERAQVSAPGSDELGRLGQAINALLLRLRASDAQRAAFVSDAGHELRSPLATVAISLDQLRSDPEPARRAVIAQRAGAEVQRLSELVDDLLALAASDEGRLGSELVDVDLDDIVLTEVGVARAKGAQVAVTLAPTRVRGVGPQLQRVIRNLLDNARRHADRQIMVTVGAQGATALLIVDNDGDPVPAEDRRRIFARFVRLDDARGRERGGSGLGLSIVAALVAAHGGSVEATETTEGWCRFVVRLPLAVD